MSDALTGPTTELLQALIRNECVNDGTPDSGFESRNAELLTDYLEGAGLDVARFESRPGRASVVARIEGSDPTAPSLCLMGHTDVVPVNPAGWHEDPFGGELINGEVWGRGAIDMLNLTASMAVAFRQLASSGFRPKGTLIYLGVADEEAGGTWGARWLADHHWEAIAADYCLTELGGWSMPSHDGVRRLVVNVGEKGIAWRKLRVKGTPAHGSMPYGSDNALVKAAEIVRRLGSYQPRAEISDIWRYQVDRMDLPAPVRAALLNPATIGATLAQLPPVLAKRCHAMTHTTISPNVVHGGQKTNIIPDLVELEVDIRTLPGTTGEDVDAFLQEALGDLARHVEVSAIQQDLASESPMGNPLWDVIAKRAQVVYPGAELVPSLIVGGTDARFYRERGAVAYGAGLYSADVTAEVFGDRFHGHDERIDVASLGLSADFFVGVATDLLS